jgi:hypothetical protein
MSKPALMQSLAALLLISLTGCVTPQTPNVPVVSGNKTDIAKRLAPICPQPTRWSPAEMDLVADAIEAVPQQNRMGIDHLAGEWDRLNRGAMACRREPVGS